MFGGIHIALNLDEHDKRNLMFNKVSTEKGSSKLGDYTEYKCQYIEETGGNQVELIFQSYADFTAVYVEAGLEEGKLFQSQSSFTAKHAVTITLNGEPENYQLMANYQHKDWWTRPFFGEDLSKIPEKTQSLLLKTTDTYYHMLPVVDEDYRTEIAGSAEGLQLSLSAYQGGFREISTFALILGADKSPFELVDSNVERATCLLGNTVLPRKEKPYPEILEYLGWCSWDAFHHKVNEQGIFDKLNEMQHQDVPIKWVMIDDGWSDIKDDKLFSFQAEKSKFPKGLSNTAKELKQKYGINWVGVWHTIGGYWDGIHPDSQIANQLQNSLYHTNRGALVPYPDAEKGFNFWHQWHKNLSQDGIDFIKVDSQSAIANFFTHEFSIGKAASGAHTALESSAALHFNNTIINCMGMAAENIWKRPYSAVSRNSDDFVPEVKEGFREHALQNAYNSFYHGSFYWGDWDMYWSKNHDDKQNMILRVVSGGPVYISDEIGRTNTDMILPLVYKDGRIIRCEQPGLPTEDSLMTDPVNNELPLKIWNRTRGTGVVAAFNISDSKIVNGIVSPQDVTGLDGETFILYDVLQKEYKSVKRDEKIDVQIEKDDVALHLVIPSGGSLIPIGLVNKLIPSDGILEKRTNGQTVSLRLKEGGDFAFVAEKPVKQLMVNGKTVKPEQLDEQGKLLVVDCASEAAPVTIDISL